jgi:small subunit ribosomal protein S12
MPSRKQLTNKEKTRKKKQHVKNRASVLRTKPFRNGTCVRVTTMKPKKPNSANRKIAKVKFTSINRRVICYIPGMGHDLREYSQVVIRGGHVPDLPGVQYHLVKGRGDFSWKEPGAVVLRSTKRSKYGIPRDQSQAFFKS